MKPKVENSETFSLYSGNRKYKVRIQQKESIYYLGKRNYSIKLPVKKGEKQKNFRFGFKETGDLYFERDFLSTGEFR